MAAAKNDDAPTSATKSLLARREPVLRRTSPGPLTTALVRAQRHLLKVLPCSPDHVCNAARTKNNDAGRTYQRQPNSLVKIAKFDSFQSRRNRENQEFSQDSVSRSIPPRASIDAGRSFLPLARPENTSHAWTAAHQGCARRQRLPRPSRRDGFCTGAQRSALSASP